MNRESMAKVEIHKAQVHATLFSLVSLPVNHFFSFYDFCWQTSLQQYRSLDVLVLLLPPQTGFQETSE